MFSSSLFSLEYGLALLHERAPALGVILALEALEDQVPAQVAVEVVAELEHLLDDPLARLDRERRPGRDRGRVLHEQRLELLGRGDAIHQAHAQRLGAIETAAREEDVLGIARADEMGEVAHRGEAI